MSLRNILLDIATIGGIKIDNADQQQYVTFRVNQAAQEIYEQNDPIGSLREQVFSVAVESGLQISLPSSVGRVRAVRYYMPQLNLKTVDMRPRYAAKFWQSKNMLAWRLKGEYPIKRDVENASLVTVTFRKPLTVACSVTIAGTTDDAAQDSEVLEFAVGDTTLTTTKSFLSFDAISKSVATNSDCDITDVDGLELATIANNQLQSLYQIIQLINPPNSRQSPSIYSPVTPYVELLWKMRFKPFVNLDDEFQCPGYDKAIFWKYMEHKALTAPPEPELAIGYKLKCDMILEQIAHDTDQNIEKSMNFGENATFNAFEQINRYDSGSSNITPYNNVFNPNLWP